MSVPWVINDSKLCFYRECTLEWSGTICSHVVVLDPDGTMVVVSDHTCTEMVVFGREFTSLVV